MKVKFVPQNVEFEIKPGESVMHVAQDNGLYIKSVCKGVPSCAECRVRIVEGDYNVLSPGSEELGLIGTGHFIDRRRLSCQLKCFGDITVDLSEQLSKQNELTTKIEKKYGVKDDRVEQAVAIRGEDFSKDDTDGDETTPPPPAQPRPAVTVGKPSPEARPVRETRNQPASPGGSRPNRNQNSNRNQNPDRNQNQNRNQQVGQNQNRGPNQGQNKNQNQNRGPRPDRGPVAASQTKENAIDTSVDSANSASSATAMPANGDGTGRKRRRRRGRGSGAGPRAENPNQSGGAPTRNIARPQPASVQIVSPAKPTPSGK